MNTARQSMQPERAEKIERIRIAMKDVIVIPKGRSLRRYTLDHDRNGKWRIGYTWSRTYAHSITGNVYDTTLGTGPTFTEALVNAVRQQSKRRAKLEATP